jgi:hypothetical protein
VIDYAKFSAINPLTSRRVLTQSSLDPEQQKILDATMALGIAAHDADAMRTALKKGGTPDALIKRVAADNNGLLARLPHDVFQLALKQGASADLLLFAALQKKAGDVVKLAVEQGGANVNAVRRQADGSGGDFHVIHFAYNNFDKTVFDYLLAKGADINAPCADGATVLLREAKQFDDRYGTNDSEKLEYLLAKGADPLAKDGQGNFALRTMQQNSNSFVDDRIKLKMLKLMMGNMPDVGPAGVPSKPAQDFAAAVTTKDDIEVGKPIELKKRVPAP